MLKIIFCDKNIVNLNALREAFGDLTNIEYTNQDITQVKADCVVSPGNSYACMDGGVDRYINYALNYISSTVKECIQNEYYGEQPVGTTVLFKLAPGGLVSTNWKYLAHTPTMRVPTDISNSENAYIAFRSLLKEILNHNKHSDNKINSLVVTLFCSGAGSMKPETSSKQMRLAYDLIFSNLPPNWESANSIDKLLRNTFLD